MGAQILCNLSTRGAWGLAFVISLVGALLIAMVVAYADEPAPLNENQWTVELYQKVFGPEARKNIRLADGSWVDILTAEHAIEVDWAKRWQTGPGQALLYASLTNRQPAVLLLITDPIKEKPQILRCAVACKAAGIDFFTYQVKR